MIIYTIIVTFNGQHWIDFCLGSLRKSTVSTTPIIIDNYSQDNTISYIRQNYPEAIIFEQKKNLGFGQANNLGIQYAIEHNADYVLLLNQDAAIEYNMLELCLAQCNKQSLLSPIHMNGDGTRLDNNFRKNSLLQCEELINDIFSNKLKSYYVCNHICAACWLIPIAVIKKIGGFSPLFIHYAEDDNYLHRLSYHNLQLRLVPQAHMFHDRLDFGNTQIHNNRWLANTLMLTATNINLTSTQRLKQFIHTIWVCYRYKLLSHQYRIGDFFLCLIKLIFKLQQIQHSRIIEKKSNLTYL